MKPRTKQQIAKEINALIEAEVEARLVARAGEVEPLQKMVQTLSYANDKLARELRIAKQEVQMLQDHIAGCLT